MKENKDIDRLLGRELGSYEEKPRLSFETLQANYLRKEKLRIKTKAVFLSSVLILSAALMLGAYVFFSKSDQVRLKAENASLQQENKTELQKDRSFGESQDNKTKHFKTSGSQEASLGNEKSSSSEILIPDAGNSNPDLKEKEKGTVPAQQPASFSSTKPAVTKDTRPLKKKESIQDAHSNFSSSNTNKTIAYTKKHENTTELKGSSDKAKSGTGRKGAEHPEISHPAPGAVAGRQSLVRQKNSSGSNYTMEHGSQEPVGENRRLDPDPGTELLKRNEQAALKSKLKKDQPQVARENNNEMNDAPERANVTHSKSEAPHSAEEKNPGLKGENRSQKENAISSADQPGEVSLSDPLNKDDAFSLEDPDEGTEQEESNSEAAVPDHEKKHHFLVSTELLYNNLKYHVSPNVTGANEGYAQTFSDAHEVAPVKFLSGSLLLGYKYKNAGLNAGLGFLNAETKVNTTSSTFIKNSYTMRITKPFPGDTIHRADTTFILVDSKHMQVVNGDTVSPRDYINNIRIYTIPLQLNYCFYLLSGKLGIEPQAGVQIGIPVKSYQLVMQDQYVFTYSRTRSTFRSRLLFYDLSLKLSYRFGRATMYLKQGYFFNSKSIYKNDYPINYSLKNLYTAFGISLWLD